MSSNKLDKHALAKRLAPEYVKDHSGIAKLCDEVIDPSGDLLGIVRQEATKIGLTPAREKARVLIDKLCADPEMWATHGCPGEVKLARLEDELAAAFSDSGFDQQSTVK